MNIKERFDKFLADLQKGRPVPPPAAPPPLALELHPLELPVPFALQEMPRTFLHLLKISDEVSPQVRSYIETWLDDYDQRIKAYMRGKFGEGVDQVTDMITREVMNQQHTHAQTEAAAVERDVLADLEKQLREEGVHGDGEEGPGIGTA